MTSCNAIIGAIISTLSADANLSGVEFLKEFPAVRRDTPLKKVAVSVGVDKLKVQLAEEKLKLSAGAAPTTVRAKLTLCAPKTFTGQTCYGIIHNIVKGLGAMAANYNITGVETGELKYSSALGLLVLPITVTFSVGHAF